MLLSRKKRSEEEAAEVTARALQVVVEDESDQWASLTCRGRTVSALEMDGRMRAWRLPEGCRRCCGWSARRALYD